MPNRRTVIAGTAAAFLAYPARAILKVNLMHGLIGSFTAKPGQRDALTAILLEGIDKMPGCLSYVVAHDVEEADRIWATEVWDSKASHQASLKLPQVRQAIEKAMPLIAGFGKGENTVPGGRVRAGGSKSMTAVQPQPSPRWLTWAGILPSCFGT